MKLSISNIAWSEGHDLEIYDFLKSLSYEGLEIAPTRFFPSLPYDKLAEAKQISTNIFDRYTLRIASMQSIWYGKTERIFGSEQERMILLDYTKKAIDFAHATQCKNIVFGCPKNRIIDRMDQLYIAIEFFNELGDYAKLKNTIVAIEPNPTIYGTNFINTSLEAFNLVNQIDNEGIKVNIDFGTILENNEELTLIADNINLVNHVHISEPNLMPIQSRDIHKELAIILNKLRYQNFVSIEMKNQENIVELKRIIEYIKEIFA